jgi:hypothetical protein
MMIGQNRGRRAAKASKVASSADRSNNGDTQNTFQQEIRDGHVRRNRLGSPADRCAN